MSCGFRIVSDTLGSNGNNYIRLFADNVSLPFMHIILRPYYVTFTYSVLFDCQVQAIVHLYPLWSAALQGNVDFQTDDGVEAETPVCRTNAVVESHFKSVKHGRLEGRLRVRPRNFVSAELKYVLGKVNEQKMPKVRVQKKKSTAATEEQWRRRKRTARYADPATATRLLEKVAKQSRTTSKSATATADDESVKRQPTAPTVVVKSADIAAASSVHDLELDGDAISRGLDQMRAHFTNLDGLQPPGIGQCVVGLSVPRFKPVTRPFVQVLNVGDHWLTCTNIFSASQNEVHWYDSMHGSVSPLSVVQLTSLLRRNIDSDDIRISRRVCAHQPRVSRLCGYYALAAAYAICNGIDPTGFEYDAQTMVDVINRNLSDGRVDMVPATTISSQVNICVQTVDKRHCICHRPSSIRSSPVTMIECTFCGNWFHVECVSTTARQLRRQSEQWIGPCCKVPDKKAVIVDVDDDTATRTDPETHPTGLYRSSLTMALRPLRLSPVTQYTIFFYHFEM